MCEGSGSELHATAEVIKRVRSQWMVLFGCYSRRFWAYPLFPVRRQGIVVSAYYPSALITRMDEAERVLRIYPGDEE